MAENLDNPTMGNFSIENTMEFGAGNQELLNDLFAPETSTTNPDDIQDIKDEPAPEKKAPTKKEANTTTEETTEKPDPSKSIADFLSRGDEDDDTEDDDAEDTKPAKKTATEPSTEENTEETDETNQFSALSKDLYKLGVFSKEDDEEESPITTPEEFLERFNAEKKKGAIEVVNNFIGQFGEDYQKAFNAIYVNGVDPKEYFGTYNKIVNFAELDLSIEDNQVAVMRQALTDQGFEPEDVTTEVDRLKNYGDLETVAAKHHKVLVKREAVKLQELEQQAGQELQQKMQLKISTSRMSIPFFKRN